MTSDAARALLRDYIESFEQLEVLFLLRRQRQRVFEGDEVATELKTRSSLVDEALEHLARVGLLAPRGRSRFQYAPSDVGLESAANALAELYEQDRLEVMRLMSANAIERVRTNAMKTFADAFLLGGRKKDG